MKKTKKLKKFFKIMFFSFFALGIIAIFSGAIFYQSVTHSLTLDTEKLNETQLANNIKIFDKDGLEITKQNQSYIKLSKLSTDTKNAFICAEDKRFYSHHGIDFIRMGKATLSNIKSRSFAQGASTISQQLIKNTQLSNEKTIKRKLKEIKLTTLLEKQYSKNEILEMYLNNIYFGNGCYGIESASKHYFSKSASKLTLAEATALSACINAPTIYDIEQNPEKVKLRRNLILKIMQNSNKISEKAYQNAINEEILTKIQNISSNDFLFSEVLNEATTLLQKTQNELQGLDIKIYTKLDTSLCSNIKSNISKNYSNLESNPSVATIIIDNKTNKIVSITGKKSVLKSKIQPGSTIKPILVFAPAIENGTISPSTKILDEEINIGGYSPKNSNGKYHGYVTVREALINSYNIPAVKILNEIKIENGQNFAKKIGIIFSENDNNLAIALGGFTDGITLKSIADAYCAFANLGKFKPSSLIEKITIDGKIIYEDLIPQEKVMKDSTAYLITNMLLETSKTGTAKRLKDFDFEIASKTGTVGDSSSSKNRESFNVSYTTDYTILSYIGGTLMPENINGATYATMLTKDILSYIYKTNSPTNFIIPNSVRTLNLENSDDHFQVKISTDNENSFTEYFDKDNIPNFLIPPSLELSVSNFENEKPILKFKTSKNFEYKIIRKNKEAEEILSSAISDENIEFIDKTAKNNQIYEYFVQFCDFSTNKCYETNHIKLKTN